MSSEIDQLYTLQSLLTLQGATAATVLVPNVAVRLFGDEYTQKQRLWTAFGIAMALSLLAASVADGPWTRWVIAFFNGCLVFAAAVGLNETSIQGSGARVVSESRARGARVHGSRNRSWLRSP